MTVPSIISDEIISHPSAIPRLSEWSHMKTTGKTYRFLTNQSLDNRKTLQRALERHTVLQLDKTTSSYQVIL